MTVPVPTPDPAIVVYEPRGEGADLVDILGGQVITLACHGERLNPLAMGSIKPVVKLGLGLR